MAHDSKTQTCPICWASLEGERWERLRQCPQCGRLWPLPARLRIAQLIEPLSFQEIDAELGSADPLRFNDGQPYPERLSAAQATTGLREAAITGVGRIAGCTVVLIVLDFTFMGGSMGSVVGEKIARAFERGVRDSLPVVSVVATGGARMQEGLLALLQMAKTVAAWQKHHDRGLPYLSILANPTTGGPYASFASRGDILIAEPGAMIAFAGPRVAQLAFEEPVPPELVKAETLLTHGHLDMVVPREKLTETVAGVLGYLARREGQEPGKQADRERRRRRKELDAWAVVQLARHSARPTSLDFVAHMVDEFIELHGDRMAGDDPALVGGLARLSGIRALVLAQERGRAGETGSPGGRIGPAGFRKATRLLRLAGRFGLPVITLVDTPGAQAGAAAAAGNVAGALSECLSVLLGLPVPTLAAVIGEGGSGGAVALAATDRVLMLENAIYSVISPEGAAAILHSSIERSADMARALRVTADDAQRLGVVDEVVAEPPGGAHTDTLAAARLLQAHLLLELRRLRRLSTKRLLEVRYKKYRGIGVVREPSRLRWLWRGRG